MTATMSPIDLSLFMLNSFLCKFVHLHVQYNFDLAAYISYSRNINLVGN